MPPPFLTYDDPTGTTTAYMPAPNRGILGPDGLPWSDPDGKRSRGPESGFPVSPVIMFSSVLGSGWRTYWHDRWDEAMRHGREQALAMKRDAFLMGLMQERRFATSSLKCHVEVDDKRDPRQKAIADGLQKTVHATPRFRKLCAYLLWCVWYGRYGAALKWEWQSRRVPDLRVGPAALGTGGAPGSSSPRRCLTVAAHSPVSGDSIGHHWDGTPYVLVHAAYAYGLENADVGTTTVGGRALFLRGSWRQHYIIHAHEVEAADFFAAEAAERMHGVGVRDAIYWINWIRQEGISNILDWCERTGLGVRLWYYQGGNAASRAAVQKAAKDQSDKVNLLIPRFGDRPVEGVDYVATDGTGAELLLRLQEHYQGIEERYIVGQSMSSGADTDGSLGGSGKAKFAADTKRRLVEFDAANLGETLTEDVVKPMATWTYPEVPYEEHNARLVFDVDQDDPEEILKAAKTFTDMGGTVIEDEVRGPLGFSSPQEGDKVLGGQPAVPAPGQPSPGSANQPGTPQAPAAQGTPGNGTSPNPPQPDHVQRSMAGPVPAPAAGPARNARRRKPRRYTVEDDAGHRHGDDGRFTGTGGGAPKKGGRLTRVGRKVLSGAVKLEHGAKQLLKDQFARLPRAVRAPVAGAIKTYYATYVAAQKAVDAVARERGLSEEQRDRLTSALTTADVVLGAKVVPAIAAASGAGAVAAGAASFVPPASVAYLAYSTARSPAATYRAARAGVRALLAKRRGEPRRHRRIRGR